MSGFIKTIKEYTLPVAMLTGALGYRLFSILSPLTPWLIVIMLFFTFCKVNPHDMHLQRWHGVLLLFQLIVSVLFFYVLRPINLVLAQGLMVCILMPTATAAAVITGKLGGSVESLTTYTMVSNLAVALFAPALFPFVHLVEEMTFTIGFLIILNKVFPLLIGPFFAAWLFRIVYTHLTNKPFTLHPVLAASPFYVWAFSLVILTANTVHSLILDDYNGWAAIGLAIGALAVCLLQFGFGKWVGQRYGMRISAGQALGQKNTILGIWMAHSYLIPVSALGPAAYILWQNMFNSWQLWKHEHTTR